MKLPHFKLEEYFAKYEFTAPYLLCTSDAESFTMQDLLTLADEECLGMWNDLHLGYTETQGHPLLRKEISQLYSNIDSNHILTFVGGGEAIYCTMHTLLNPEDHVIVVTPNYQSLETIPRSICRDVSAIALDPQNDWKLDLEQMHSMIKESTKMIIINFPHNPTGALLTKEEQLTLVEMARENDIIIFSDEAYRYLEMDETPPAIVEIYEKGISMSVLSKGFGLPGLRMGWIACQEEDFIKKINETKHYITISHSAPSEILSIMALRAKNQLIKRNREIMFDNLKILEPFFERHKDLFTWTRPKGGCIGLPKLLIDEPVESFAERLVEKEGVLLLPGSAYDYEDNYFRIGFGKKNFPESLKRFERFINENHKS